MNRHVWFDRQFPPGKLTVPDVIRRTGWLHTAGGTGPYLSLRARIPNVTRQHIDDLVYRKLEVLELPCVRESTMLVPPEDAAVALAAGRRAMMTRLKKLSVDAEQVDALAERIVKTLGDGTRSADQLRSEIPPKLITDLGEAGKKLGFTSTLPVALRLLQAQGRVIRLGEEMRLDAKRYFYRRWPASLRLEDEPDDLDGELAKRFLNWAAPATVDDFAFFAGIGKTAAKKALSVGQAILPVRSPAKGVMLLPFRDNYFELHRDWDEVARRHNTIVLDGELRGIWEYDPDAEKIVWRTFQKTRGVEAAVAGTETFIREELGDHQFYAFDHGKTREVRLASVKE